MKYLSTLIAAGAVVLGGSTASAQYTQIANQLPGLIRPMISGSLNYKGYVDATFTKGLGDKNVDFLSFSTSQGFKYSNWFFMGVGLGVDVVFTHNDKDEAWYPGPQVGEPKVGLETTGVMMPVFTDFRFNIGGMQSASFFVDLKLGASFLLGNKYLLVDKGYLSNREYFMLRPSLGVRIPVNSKNSSQALNLGVTYQLLTANYGGYWATSVGTSAITINSLGATVGFEW